MTDLEADRPPPGEREQIAALRVEVRHLTAAVRGLETKVDQLTAQANRWKGAFLVVLAIGGGIGWLVDRALSLAARS